MATYPGLSSLAFNSCAGVTPADGFLPSTQVRMLKWDKIPRVRHMRLFCSSVSDGEDWLMGLQSPQDALRKGCAPGEADWCMSAAVWTQETSKGGISARGSEAW